MSLKSKWWHDAVVQANGVELKMRDALEVVNTSDSQSLDLQLASGSGGSHFMIIEMARA